MLVIYLGKLWKGKEVCNQEIQPLEDPWSSGTLWKCRGRLFLAGRFVFVGNASLVGGRAQSHSWRATQEPSLQTASCYRGQPRVQEVSFEYVNPIIFAVFLRTLPMFFHVSPWWYTFSAEVEIEGAGTSYKGVLWLLRVVNSACFPCCRQHTVYLKGWGRFQAVIMFTMQSVTDGQDPCTFWMRPHQISKQQLCLKRNLQVETATTVKF